MTTCPLCRHHNHASARQCEECGAWLGTIPGQNPAVDEGFRQTLRKLVADGRKIEAIKLHREATGVGLRESKDYVEALDQPILASASSLPPGLEQRILGLMREGQKIGAIKLHREATGVGLKESKDYVEALAARAGIETQASGCLGAVVLVVLAAGAAAAVVHRLA